MIEMNYLKDISRYYAKTRYLIRFINNNNDNISVTNEFLNDILEYKCMN